ncbi:MAG TPA: hypothetical protein VG389_05875, partial [Myxococcota bacterium]|nr:hypothetical protein [Myxococcota bacterium]
AVAALDRALPPLLARRWEELQQGKSTGAGPFAVTKDALAFKGERVELASVHVTDVQKGWFFVWLKGREKSWAQLDLGTEDAPVVVPLVRRLLKSRAA